MSISVRIGEAWVPAVRRARLSGDWAPPVDDPIVITADIEPELQAMTNGDTVENRLSEGALDVENYSSTAGEIVSVIAAVSINGDPADIDTPVAWDDEVEVDITVTDDASNTRVYSLDRTVASEPAATAPAQFLSGQWSVNDDGDVTFTTLPNNGGSPITDLQYRLDTGSGFGSAVSFGETTTGTYATTGAEGDLVQVRAINAVDPDPSNWSTSKPVPGEASTDVLQNFLFDPETGSLSFDTTESGTLYGMTTSETERTAQQIIDGTGAEDSFTVEAAFGEFSEAINLPNTATGVDRYLHGVIVYGDDQRSNAARSDAFQLELEPLDHPTEIEITAVSPRKRLIPMFQGVETAKATIAFRIFLDSTTASRDFFRTEAGDTNDSVRISTDSSSRPRASIYDKDDQTNMVSNDLRFSAISANTWLSIMLAIDFTKTDLGSGVMAKLWINGTSQSSSATSTDKLMVFGASGSGRQLFLPFTGTYKIDTWFWATTSAALDPATHAGTFFDSTASWATKDIWLNSEGIVGGATPTHFITGNAANWNSLINRGSGIAFTSDGTFTEPA